MTDDDILQHWSSSHAILPEYQAAAGMVCVPQRWMRSTLFLSHAREISELCGSELSRIEAGGDSLVRSMVLGLIDYSYNLHGDLDQALNQQDILSGKNILEHVMKVYHALEPWKKPMFTLSLQIMSSLAERGAVSAKLVEIVDRSLHCRQVQVTSLNLILSYSAHLIRVKAQGASGATRQNEDLPYSEALRKFYECFETFLDDHKENALNATFVEPNRFYWARTVGRSECPHFLVDNVDTHAVNWYIALLNSALGVHVPRQAVYWDDFAPPVVDFWAGLADETWEAFRDPKHFGSSWQGNPRIVRGGNQLLKNRNLTGGYLPHNPPRERNHKTTCLGAAMNKDLRPASRFANEAVNPNAPAQQRVCIAQYLERFSWCFSQDFFVQKCFECLNSEQKPEHVGVRAALETLFGAYKLNASNAVPEEVESYIEYCYKDDMYMHLDIEATSRFFMWIGVVRPTSTDARSMDPISHTEAPEYDWFPQDATEDQDGDLRLALALSLAERDGSSSQKRSRVASLGEAFMKIPWACGACTFINEPMHSSCSICDTQRAVSCQ
jgi:hypothetical protein